MKPLDFRGRWALVTGASAGLGERIAHQLAKRGAHVILVARRAERLDRLGDLLETQYRVRTVRIPLDLGGDGAPALLFREATRGRDVYALVCNASRYWFGPFTSMDEAAVSAMLRLNVAVPVELLRRFLAYRDERGSGGALVVSSIGGAFPSPMQSLYSSTKAQLFALARNLWVERGGARAGVTLTVCMPGGMLTEMLTTSPVMHQLRKHPIAMRSMMAPDRVAFEAVEGFARGLPQVVPGRWNRFLIRLSRVLPEGMVADGAARVYGVQI